MFITSKEFRADYIMRAAGYSIIFHKNFCPPRRANVTNRMKIFPRRMQSPLEKAVDAVV